MVAPAREQPPFDPRQIVASLERHRANYVLIGGLARVLRGCDEITTGVDITPAFGADSLERLAAALQELAATQTNRRRLEVTERLLSERPVIALTTAFGALNIVAKPAGVARGFIDLRRAATREDLGHGLRPYIASAGDLAGMAAALHRDQDIAVLPALRRIIELEVDRAQTIGPPQVRGPARHTSGLDLTPRRDGPKLTR